MSKVKQARRRAGLSQTELAERAGVAPSTVVVAESGHRQPQGRTLRKLADALDVTVADLLEDEVEAETPPKAAAPSSTGGKGAITPVAEQTLFEHVNMLKAAADKWQAFTDKKYYVLKDDDLKGMDLEDLEATDRADLHIVIVHGRHAAAIKHEATDEQREILEQAERRLLGTINTFWSKAEPYLTVTDLAAVRAEREGWDRVSSIDAAGSRAG